MLFSVLIFLCYGSTTYNVSIFLSTGLINFFSGVFEIEWKQEIVQNGSLDKMNSVIISAIYHGISCLESRLNKHLQAILPATKNISLKHPIWWKLQGATISDQNLKELPKLMLNFATVFLLTKQETEL